MLLTLLLMEGWGKGAVKWLSVGGADDFEEDFLAGAAFPPSSLLVDDLERFPLLLLLLWLFLLLLLVRFLLGSPRSFLGVAVLDWCFSSAPPPLGVVL